MSKCLAFLFACVAYLCFPATGQAGLVISEIMSKPSGGTSNNEWFEVFNSSGGSINLSTIKFDDAANASAGTFLSGTLGSGKYAIVTSLSSASWVSLYGALPSTATIVTVSKTLWNLGNASDTLTLYNTLTSQNFFTLSYGTSTTGTSLQFNGTSASLIAPYSFTAGKWQNATALPGGSLGSRHSAGSSNLRVTAPEPATWAILCLASLGLVGAIGFSRLSLVVDRV